MKDAMYLTRGVSWVIRSDFILTSHQKENQKARKPEFAPLLGYIH